jgi:hypothetical protein
LTTVVYDKGDEIIQPEFSSGHSSLADLSLSTLTVTNQNVHPAILSVASIGKAAHAPTVSRWTSEPVDSPVPGIKSESMYFWGRVPGAGKVFSC